MATGRIGPGGGTLVLSGQQGAVSGAGAELDVPGDALAADLTLTIVETDLSPPASLFDYSPVYSFEPTELALATPATFRVPWGSDKPAPPGLAAFWAGCNDVFHFVSSVSVERAAVLGTTTRLGWVVVGVPKGPGTQACP